MLKELTEGDLVESKMGHDEGRIYVITRVIDKDFVFICDGRIRELANAKRKRKKHLRFLGKSELESGKYRDEDIKKAIKSWRERCQEKII